MNAFDIDSLNRRNEVFLLDVRTPVEFRQGHLAGSENIPLDRLLSGEAVQFPPGKRICLVCQSGKRAEKARIFLQENRGIEAIMLDGGVEEWKNCGLCLEKDEAVHGVTLMRQVQMVIGFVNLVSFVLAWLVSPYWLIVPAVTSMGLLFAGITGFCGLAVVLAKMPWNKS